MATFTVRDTGTDYVTVRVAGMTSGVATINMYYRKASASTNTYIESIGSSRFTNSGGSYRYDYTYEDLEPGTSYVFTVAFYNSSGERVDTETTDETTAEEDEFEEPTIDVTSTSSTDSSVRYNVRVDAASAGKFYVEFYISYLGTSQSHTSSSFSLSDGESKPLSWEFTGIPNGTTVTAYAYVYDYSSDDLYDSVRTTITTQGTARPSDWYWTSTVSKGAEIPYEKISDTKYEVYPLTAKEWNGFVDRIVAFGTYLGQNFAGISGLYVTAGTEMDYEIPEAARQVIDSLDPPTAVPSAISSGSRITAAFINGLKNSLNSIE